MDLRRYTQAGMKSIFGENDRCTLPWAAVSSACLLTGRFHATDFHSPMWVLHLGWCHMQPLGDATFVIARGCYICHFQQPWALHSLWELKLLFIYTCFRNIISSSDWSHDSCEDDDGSSHKSSSPKWLSSSPSPNSSHESSSPRRLSSSSSKRFSLVSWWLEIWMARVV